jgi:dihydroxyacetone kinase-like protein
MGMALTSCTVPAAGKPTFELAGNEMEMGIGIHGEPGRERMPIQPVLEIVTRMTDAILADLPVAGGHSVIAMVNGMGGTPLIELYLAYRELERVLQARGIAIARRMMGNFITSLDMAGCSVTLLRADDELITLWDDPVLTPGLRWGA